MKISLTVKGFFDVLLRKRITLAILAVLFVFPLMAPSRYYMLLLAEMLIWALLAMSYDLTLGHTGLVSFGHAALFGIGAYTSALLLRMNFPFPLAVLASILFGALIGLTMGIFTLRVSGIYYALVTLAFAEMIFAIFNKWVGLSGGETGIAVPRPDFLRSELFLYLALTATIAVAVMLLAIVIRELKNRNAPAKTKILYSALLVAVFAVLIYALPSASGYGDTTILVMNIYYFLALIPLILCYFAANRIVNSPMGRIFIAIRENEERAKMLGYNVFKYKLISSSISGIFAGLAGALYAPFILSINPASVLSSVITINVLLYSILGGLGTLIGPMIGAGIITLLANELTRIPYIGQYWMFVLGIFYLLVIMFLPYGIVITWRIKGVSAKRTLKKLLESIKPSASKGAS